MLASTKTGLRLLLRCNWLPTCVKIALTELSSSYLYYENGKPVIREGDATKTMNSEMRWIEARPFSPGFLPLLVSLVRR